MPEHQPEPAELPASHVVERFDAVLKERLRGTLGDEAAQGDSLPGFRELACFVLVAEREAEIRSSGASAGERFTRDELLEEIQGIAQAFGTECEETVRDLVDRGLLLLDGETLAASERLLACCERIDGAFPRAPGIHLLAYIIQTMEEARSGRKDLDWALSQFEQTLAMYGEDTASDESVRSEDGKELTDEVLDVMSIFRRKVQQKVETRNRMAGADEVKSRLRSYLDTSARGTSPPRKDRGLEKQVEEESQAERVRGFAFHDLDPAGPSTGADGAGAGGTGGEAKVSGEDMGPSQAPGPATVEEVSREEAGGSPAGPEVEPVVPVEPVSSPRSFGSVEPGREDPGTGSGDGPGVEPQGANPESVATPATAGEAAGTAPQPDGGDQESEAPGPGVDEVPDDLIEQRIAAFEKELGVTECPLCGKGAVREQRTSKGKVFYKCTRRSCSFISWGKPHLTACPECKSPFLVERTTPAGQTVLTCPRATCPYRTVHGQSAAGRPGGADPEPAADASKAPQAAVPGRPAGGKKKVVRKVVVRKKR